MYLYRSVYLSNGRTRELGSNGAVGAPGACASVRSAGAISGQREYLFHSPGCPTVMSDQAKPITPQDSLPHAVGQSWRTFLEQCEPLRPELYRYCRYLARSPWEADDLVQDTLMR